MKPTCSYYTKVHILCSLVQHTKKCTQNKDMNKTVVQKCHAKLTVVTVLARLHKVQRAIVVTPVVPVPAPLAV